MRLQIWKELPHSAESWPWRNRSQQWTPSTNSKRQRCSRSVFKRLNAALVEYDVSIPLRLSAGTPSGQPASNLFRSPEQGAAAPLGASFNEREGTTNFALFSSTATAVELCLFDEHNLRAGRVLSSVHLDPLLNKTGDIWHIQLPGLDQNLLYGFRVHGHNQEQGDEYPGHRHNAQCVVLDPYGKAVISRRQFGQMGEDLDYRDPGILGLANTWPQGACSLPGPPSDFDWEGDVPLELPMEDLIIYEMHVRGFTWDRSSGTRAPGTYSGLVEKLDYIQNLGVNAIELLPIHEFNELEYYQLIPGSDNEYRFNYWGYSTAAYMAPMARYSQASLEGQGGTAIVDEFKNLVKECHKRGIEVLLDVVFNHTAEGNEQGPTISFRGLDNRVYYMLAPEGQYYNYSGCGNTFNCNHPQARKFILDCLRYWVVEMHVDGFRFDLASIMTRAPSIWHRGSDETSTSSHAEEGAIPLPPKKAEIHPPAFAPDQNTGNGRAIVAEANSTPRIRVEGLMKEGAGAPTGTPLTDPPLIEMISEDPVLRNTKLIAEAWDCDGLNQIGAFPHYGGRWAEWNGHFRDTVRQFIKGTEGPWASHFASAMCGSPDIYSSPARSQDWWNSGDGNKWQGNRSAAHSVNFVTAHDGFSLADLVSFNQKHNSANGEKNRDGETNNLTWNCGVEGPTDDLKVQRLRARQQRNLAAALLLAQGVPMVQMGDDYGHSKGGNNNTYCHDSPLNWFNWAQAEEDKTGFARFFRQLVNFRRARPELRQRKYLGPEAIQFHGEKAGSPDWSEDSRLVAFSLGGFDGGLYAAFNTGHRPVSVELPDWYGRQWKLVMDTGKAAPYDFLAADDQLSATEVDTIHRDSHAWLADRQYRLLPYSCCLLESKSWDWMPDRSPYSAVLPPVDWNVSTTSAMESPTDNGSASSFGSS